MAKKALQKLLITSIFWMSACAEKEDLSFCVDPIGMDLYSAGHKGWICFLPEINGCFMFETASPSKITSVALQGHTWGTIVDVGAAECLGDVTEKPSSGYAISVPAQVNHGYVIKFPDDSYARFFIVSVEKNSSGQITSIDITRQYGF